MTPGRAFSRHLSRRLWLPLLSILGIAIGVAVVVAIDTASDSARAGFAASSEAIAGKSTHVVSCGSRAVPDSLFLLLNGRFSEVPAAPVVEGTVTIRGESYTILGIDVFSEGPFRSFVPQDGSIRIEDLMVGAHAVLSDYDTAAQLKKGSGDTLHARRGGLPVVLRIADVMEPQSGGNSGALQNVLLSDIAAAQELLGLKGLSRIDLIVPDRLVEPIARSLPEGCHLERSSSRTETLLGMTRAIDTNLTALSLLALLVGMFLIYNTITYSVVQRRSLIGKLRAIGVTRREVVLPVLREALVLGIAGSVLGVLLGIVLGNGLVRFTAQTINDLYFAVSVKNLQLSTANLTKGFLLGVGATLLAAVPPLREAATVPVGVALHRSSLEQQRRSRPLRLLLYALVFLGAAAAFLIPDGGIIAAYVGLFFIVCAFAALTPLCLTAATALLRPIAGAVFGLYGRMALGGLNASRSRVVPAIAALSLAVAAAIGVGVMVQSFRTTVTTWLTYTLQADVYTRPAGPAGQASETSLNPELARQLINLPEVGEVYGLRLTRVQTNRGSAMLQVLDQISPTIQYTKGDAAGITGLVNAGRAVIVTEPYAFRNALNTGDSISIATPDGDVTYPIAGVFYDYGSDQGAIVMNRKAYIRHFRDTLLTGIAFDAAPGVTIQRLEAAVRKVEREGRQELNVRSNRALREEALDVFDRTFTITAVLRVLAVITAIIGILTALLAIQLERSRELATFRSLGMTTGQVSRYLLLQSGFAGFIAGVLSLPLGITLAAVLVYVINRRSFGWTLQFEVDPLILAQAILVSVVAAILAGLYPAWRTARMHPAEALREEQL